MAQEEENTQQDRVCPVTGQVFDFVPADSNDHAFAQDQMSKSFEGYSFQMDEDRNGEVIEENELDHELEEFTNDRISLKLHNNNQGA